MVENQRRYGFWSKLNTETKCVAELIETKAKSVSEVTEIVRKKKIQA